MTQHITRHVVKRNSPQHQVLLLVRQHGVITVEQLLGADIYSPLVSGGWVQRVQTLLDRGLIIVIDNTRMVSKVAVGANDRPPHLQMTLTSRAMSELRRLDALRAASEPKPDASADPALVCTSPRMPPDFGPVHNPLARPPVLRAGSMDFVRCPSKVGSSRIEYAPHC